jgi:hypothetical protein
VFALRADLMRQLAVTLMVATVIVWEAIAILDALGAMIPQCAIAPGS